MSVSVSENSFKIHGTNNDRIQRKMRRIPRIATEFNMLSQTLDRLIRQNSSVKT